MASLSLLILMEGFIARPSGVSPVMERNRFLSQALAAFDTSSRRKTSRFE